MKINIAKEIKITEVMERLIIGMNSLITKDAPINHLLQNILLKLKRLNDGGENGKKLFIESDFSEMVKDCIEEIKDVEPDLTDFSKKSIFEIILNLVKNQELEAENIAQLNEISSQIKIKKAHILPENSKAIQQFREDIEKKKLELIKKGPYLESYPEILVMTEQFKPNADKDKITIFAKKHHIEVAYDNSYKSRVKIKQLENIPPNSALIVSGTETKHHDTFIKNEKGEIINVLVYASLSQYDKINYNPKEYYNNDICPLIMNNAVKQNGEKDYPVLMAQADNICCFGFGLKYIKTLLSNGSANLKKSFAFEMINSNAIWGVPDSNGGEGDTSVVNELTRHFIPCAEVLKYSQSDQYNKAVLQFVCCGTEQTFTLIHKEETFTVTTLYGHLMYTLEKARENNNDALIASTQKKIEELASFQKTFAEDYEKIVVPYRKQHGGGKEVVLQEACRIRYPKISEDQGDESSVEDEPICSIR